jgi:type II secretory pathway pseudopilin PulG
VKVRRALPPGETGAVLIEALVAVLIIAGLAGVWFQTVNDNARTQVGLAERRTAMLVAQSQLATVGVLGAVTPGERVGSDAGMNYTIRVAAAADGLNRVTVTVARPGGGPLAVLETLKAGR